MGSIQTQLELLGEGTYVYNEKAYPLDISVLDEFFFKMGSLYFSLYCCGNFNWILGDIDTKIF